MYLQAISKACLFGDTRKCKHRTNINFSALSSSSSKAKAYWDEKTICLTAVLRHKTQYSVEVVIFYASCNMTSCQWRLYQRLLMIILVLLNCGVVRDAALLGMMMEKFQERVLPVLLGIVEYKEQKAGGWFYTFLKFIFPSVLRKVSVIET